MSSISIKWDRRAVKELESLPRAAQQRIYQAVTGLVEDPLKGKALSGRGKGLRRLRIGPYRVIYSFDGARLLVSVIRVGDRRDIYRF
ncbi:MAG TPA: type II toxin-antitoxin system RelE/ParE family toxin [Thermoanaerobaculia bacterium]